MSERDVLSTAAKALRETYPGAKAGAGFTRGRIMATLHERRRRRLSRWIFFGPLGVLLIGGSAWAQATGRLPLLWQHAQEWFVEAQPQTQPLAAVTQPGRGSGATQPLKPLPTAADALAAEAEEAESLEVEPPLTEEPEPLEVEEPRLTEKPVAQERTVSLAPPRPETADADATPLEPAGSVSFEAAPDPELTAFRKAHRLHFHQADAAAALAAYERYLQRFSRGRFVPEARYNSAVNLLKLGRPDRARPILESFARGAYGNYRKEQAQALLASDLYAEKQVPDVNSGAPNDIEQPGNP